MQHRFIKILTAVVLSTTSVVCIQAQGIRFANTTFQEAVHQAIKEKKLLFMDCYTEWCGPCKMLSRKVFPNEKVGDFFNQNFVSLKMDMEKGEGVSLAKTYRIDSYPTLLFIDPHTQEVIYRKTGAKSDIEWLIEEGKKATDPKRNLMGAKQAYLQNKTEATIVLHYLGILNAASLHQEKDSVLRAYLPEIHPEKRFSNENWKILEAHVNNPYTSAFDYLHQHAAKFRQEIGKEIVDRKFDRLYNQATMQFIKRKRIPNEEFNEKNFRKLQRLLKEEQLDNAPFYRAQLNMVEHVQKGDYKGMMQSMENAIKKGDISEKMHFYFVWLNLTYLQESSDKAAINSGLKWLDKLQPEEKDKVATKIWLNMKAKLYTAKGDKLKADKLKQKAEALGVNSPTLPF